MGLTNNKIPDPSPEDEALTVTDELPTPKDQEGVMRDDTVAT